MREHAQDGASGGGDAGARAPGGAPLRLSSRDLARAVASGVPVMPARGPVDPRVLAAVGPRLARHPPRGRSRPAVAPAPPLVLLVEGCRPLREIDPEARPRENPRPNEPENWFEQRAGGHTSLPHAIGAFDRMSREIVLRVQGPTAGTRARWTVHDDTTGRQVAVPVHPDGTGASARIARPRGPSKLIVQCTTGGASGILVVWLVRGRVEVRGQGDWNADNRGVDAAVRALGAGSRPPMRLGPLIRGGLGNGGRTDRSLYGVLTEIVGTVEPANVPCRLHLPRRVVSAHSWGVVQRQRGPLRDRPPGDDDTSLRTILVQVPNAAGQVFDTDAPGAEFQEDEPLGQRHRHQFEFEQLLALGPAPDAAGSGAAWAPMESRGLAISTPVRWRTHQVLAITARPTDNRIAPTIDWVWRTGGRPEPNGSWQVGAPEPTPPPGR